jgi:diguanylate cyclase (GGDEF)-like protein/PAS domain S-box-containing protein
MSDAPQLSAVLQRVKHIAWLALFIWTLLLGASLVWNAHQEHKHMLETVRKVAHNDLNNKLGFQGWLEHSGQAREAGNCFQAINEFMEEAAYHGGIYGRLLTIPALNGTPPDSWEERVLEQMLAVGAEEVYEVVEIDGEPYLRLMKPTYNFLPCALENQDKAPEEFDMAFSLALPLRTYYAYLYQTERHIASSHGALWLLGIGVIGFFARRARQRLRERALAEEKLRQAAKVFESTSEGVVVTDAQARIITVNPAFISITGYREDEVIGKNPRILNSGRHDQAFFQSLWASVEKTGKWHGEIWNRRKNGDVYPEWLNVGVVRDAGGKLTNYIGVFSDITAIKESEQQLNYLAHHDPLTGLPNRLLFNARLEHTVQQARRRHTELAVLFLDLDRFKNINDTLGHASGDDLLRQVARRLSTSLREEDTLARLGGDEFVIIIESLNAARDSAKVADKLLDILRQPLQLLEHEVFIGASLGISVYPADGEDCETLVKHADIAMYRAKHLGRNNYQFYTQELTESMFHRFTLENGLRRALDRQEMVLYYQPQLDVAQSRITGVEALIRWQHPERGLLLPGNFIPLADEMGLLTRIGEWVLHAACRQARKWLDQGLPPLRMAVNVSAYQITHSDIAKTVREAIEHTGFDPHWLEVEITEDFFMQGDVQTLHVLHELKDMGITLAIDDFGTGYSSLSYLKRFPIDRIKIDQSFIRDIPRDSDDEAIARAIIAIGHTLKLTVIAEGV